MAQVNYQTSPDTQAPSEAPEDYQHVETSPATFGGALAEGGQSAGQGLLDASKFYSQVSSDQATNNLIQSATNILHGEPGKTVIGPDGQPAPDTGFLGLRGQNAMDAYTDASGALDDAIKEQQSGLKTPQARLQFDTESRRYRSQWMAQMGTHVDDQQKTWATDQNNTSIDLGLAGVARVAADDTASERAAMLVLSAAKKNAQIAGLNPDGAVFKAQQQVLLKRIEVLSPHSETAQKAQQLYDDNTALLGSLPNYGSLGRQLQGDVFNATSGPQIDSMLGDFVAKAGSMVGTPGGPSGDVSSAIGAQEWSGKGPAPTSVDGAVGNSQILPDTAKRYGLDASKLGDPAYAAMARQTITSKLSALPNVQGDPARIAVGYFSGEGNIAPLGSPTPYIHDYKDGDGKSVSSYVADVTGRMGASGGGGAYPTKADAMAANLGTFQDQLQAKAEDLYAGHPEQQEQFVTLGMRHAQQQISQQDQMYRVDGHIVQAWVAQNNPISEQQILSGPPDVAAAYMRAKSDDSSYSINMQRMFESNAHGRATGNGSQFYGYLDRALAGQNDPNRISNPGQLGAFVGNDENAPLTNTGAAALTDLIGLRGTPQGEAGAAQIKNFVDAMHNQLTYSNSAAGLIDPKGEAAFGKLMSATFPIIVKAAKSGNLAPLLDPKSSDYIGKAAQTFARTPAQTVRDRLLGEGVSTEGNDSPMTPLGLQTAVMLKKITPEEAVWISNKLGFRHPGAATTPKLLQAKPPSNQSPLPGIPMAGN